MRVEPEPNPPESVARRVKDRTAFEFGLVDYHDRGADFLEASVRHGIAERGWECLYLIGCRVGGQDAVYAIGGPRVVE